MFLPKEMGKSIVGPLQYSRTAYFSGSEEYCNMINIQTDLGVREDYNLACFTHLYYLHCSL